MDEIRVGGSRMGAMNDDSDGESVVVCCLFCCGRKKNKEGEI